MKSVFVLFCACLASGQIRYGGGFRGGYHRPPYPYHSGGGGGGYFSNGYSNPGGYNINPSFSSPSGYNNHQSSFISQPTLSFRPRPVSSNSGNAVQSATPVDARNGDYEYHYSWRHDGNQEYDHGEAVNYCTLRSGGWKPISIHGKEVDDMVNGVISQDRLTYLWTGASKSNGSFKWLDGSSITFDNWSNTGRLGRPQPDNREAGGENCLAILNNVYMDGIKWHDVACSNTKPVICERKAI